MARAFSLSMDKEEKNPSEFTKDRNKFFNIYVFDLDGTLVNTLRSLQISANIFLAEQGLKTIDDIDTFKYFVGNGTRVLVKKAFNYATGIDLSPETVEKYHERFRQIFAEHCLDEVRLYDGMLETLITLRKENSLIVCYTNKDDKLAKKCLEKLFPNDCYEIFSEIRGHIDGKNYKPDAAFFDELRQKYAAHLTDCSSCDVKLLKNYPTDDVIKSSDDREKKGEKNCCEIKVGKSSAERSLGPASFSANSEIYQTSASSLISQKSESTQNSAIAQTSPNTKYTQRKDLNFIMVGDSDVDIDTASNANVYSCACAWGFRPKEELQNKRPDFLIDRPADLLKIKIKEL